MGMGYVTGLRNEQMDAKTARVGNAGLFQLYDGTRPATGGAATTKLAEFTLGTPFAPATIGGILSPTIPSATVGLANGTATWARLTNSGGAFVADYGLATSGTEVTVNTTTVSIGVAVTITSWAETAGNV